MYTNTHRSKSEKQEVRDNIQIQMSKLKFPKKSKIKSTKSDKYQKI